VPKLSSLREQSWYALRVRSGHEKAIARVLRDRGYIEFLPLYSSVRRWSDRLEKLEVPLFPGYMFCQFAPGERTTIVKIPGIKDVVGMGRTPYPVDVAEITALQAVVRSGLLMQPWPFLKVGQRVVICEGPLRHIEGILKEIQGDHRLIVSVTLLQRSVAVSVQRTWVRPIAA
jgi:transcription antitermination factor NusG